MRITRLGDSKSDGLLHKSLKATTFLAKLSLVGSGSHPHIDNDMSRMKCWALKHRWRWTEQPEYSKRSLLFVLFVEIRINRFGTFHAIRTLRQGGPISWFTIHFCIWTSLHNNTHYNTWQEQAQTTQKLSLLNLNRERFDLVLKLKRRDVSYTF